jgi:prevent-host-death family protein
MIIADKFISITDIRKNASLYINNISTTGERLILVNNKPKAVLIDITIYEELLEKRNIEFESMTGSDEVLGTKEHKSLLSLMKTA